MSTSRDGRALPLKGPSILVIDDEPALCDMLARCLEAAGAVVSSVHTAASALDLVAQKRFDLALLDKRLGPDDGLGLIAKLLERQPDLAIVIMTGFASIEDSLAALEAGAVGYVLKPFESMGAVVREIEEVLLREERRRRASVPPASTAPSTQSLGRRSQPPDAPREIAPPRRALLALPQGGERIHLERALHERGFSTDRASTTSDLADALADRVYDVIIVDADLSGGEGVEALERARSLSRRAALVLIGSAPSLEVTTRLLRLGRALFLRRPLDAGVGGRIERALARHRAS